MSGLGGWPFILCVILVIAKTPRVVGLPGASKVEMKKALNLPPVLPPLGNKNVPINVGDIGLEGNTQKTLSDDRTAGSTVGSVQPMDHPVHEPATVQAKSQKLSPLSEKKSALPLSALVPKGSSTAAPPVNLEGMDVGWMENGAAHSNDGSAGSASSVETPSLPSESQPPSSKAVQAGSAPAEVPSATTTGTIDLGESIKPVEPPAPVSVPEESRSSNDGTAPAAMEAPAPPMTVPETKTVTPGNQADPTPGNQADPKASAPGSAGGDYAVLDASDVAETPGKAYKAEDISVVVPCIPRDVNLLPTLIQSINAQSALPHEVIIAISSTSDVDAEAIEKSLGPISTVPLSVVASKDPQPPGSNRNRGVEAASSPRISFFDADDQMHPNRIEVIQNAFDTYKAKCVIHNFSVGKFKSQFKNGLSLSGSTVITGDTIYSLALKTDERNHVSNPDPSRISINDYPIQFDERNENRYAAGNPSCTRETLLATKYTSEDRGEDNVFLRSVLSRYGPSSQSALVYVGLALTAYYPSESESNLWARQEWTRNLNDPDFDSSMPLVENSGWNVVKAPKLAITAETPSVVEGTVVGGISVIVPCVSRDVDMVPRMLKSVNHQTMLPKEIIIAASGVSLADGEALQAEWEVIAEGRYGVVVLPTPNQMSAGENRNRAVLVASQNLISFFDADDEMLPTRLSVINSAFERYDAKCVIHAFELGHSERHFSQAKEGDEHVVLGRELYNRVVAYDEVTEPEMAAAAEGAVLQIKSDLGPCRTCIDGWLEKDPSLPFLKDGLSDLAAGNPSCKKDVLEAVRYNEEARGEDAMFLRSVLGHYGRDDKTMVFVNSALTAYHPSNDPNNWWAVEEYKQHEADPDWITPDFTYQR